MVKPMIVLQASLILCVALGGCKSKDGKDMIEKARVTITMANLKHLHKAVNQFELDTGRYPTQEEGLRALIEQPADVTGWKPGGYPETKEIPKDGWGNDFIYELNPDDGGSFTIRSPGADGKQGGQGIDADLSSNKY